MAGQGMLDLVEEVEASSLMAPDQLEEMAITGKVTAVVARARGTENRAWCSS